MKIIKPWGGDTDRPGNIAMNPEIWRDVFDAIEDPISLHDAEYRVLFANRTYCRTAGVSAADALGKPYWEVFPLGAGPLPGCKQSHDIVGVGGSQEEVGVGEKVFVSNGYRLQDDQGNFLYALHVLSDITERKSIETALRESEKRFRNLVETVSDWVWEIDDKGNYTYCSPRVLDLLGYEPAEVLGKSPFDLMPAAEAQRVATIFGPSLAQRMPLLALDNVNLHKDGREVVLETSGVPIYDSQGTFKGYRGIDRDITERKRLENELKRQAHIDVLTGLNNRRHFLELAEQEVARAKRYGAPLTALMLNLDLFKLVNDSYGHQVGDIVLQKFSEVCVKTLRGIDILGRIGGEEFAILMPKTKSEQALEVAERLRLAVADGAVALEQVIPFTSRFRSGQLHWWQRMARLMTCSSAPTGACIRPKTRDAIGCAGMQVADPSPQLGN